MRFYVCLGSWWVLSCQRACCSWSKWCLHLNSHRSACMSWRSRSYFRSVGRRSSPRKYLSKPGIWSNLFPLWSCRNIPCAVNANTKGWRYLRLITSPIIARNLQHLRTRIGRCCIYRGWGLPLWVKIRRRGSRRWGCACVVFYSSSFIFGGRGKIDVLLICTIYATSWRCNSDAFWRWRLLLREWANKEEVGVHTIIISLSFFLMIFCVWALGARIASQNF